MPKVSIIVPVYNVEKYIDRCLKSLLNQTLQDIEIIIINDGSIDGSKQIIERYINNKKIKYFEKQNGGLSSARNLGLKNASGEYVAFLDSDDYVENKMYEEMYIKAKKENAEMIECDFIWEWESENKNDAQKKIKTDKRKNYKNKKEMMRRPRVVAWNKLIKTEIIKNNNIQFPEGLIYEDLEFFYKVIPHINKISYINKYFVHYIQRDGSISNTQTEKTADIFKVLDNIFLYYKKEGIYDKYKQELNYMKKRILFGSSMKRILKIKDKKTRNKLLYQTIKYIFNSCFLGNGKTTGVVNGRQERDINNKSRKILFGITKLGIGGAERVLVDIANKLLEEYDVTIFTIYGGGKLEKELNSKIKLISLYNKNIVGRYGKGKNKLIPLYILLFSKKIYNKYLKKEDDADIAFLEGPVTRILSFSKNKKIAWVHNDITKVHGKSLKAKIKKRIDKYYYKKYDKIIFVSEQNKKAFIELYGNIAETEVIRNYIDKDRVIKLSQEKIKEEEFVKKQNYEIPIFLTVARLVPQKAIDRFIRVHARLIKKGFKHKVYVIGDGEEKDNLQDLINRLNLNKTFILLGKKDNPYPYIKACDYFTLLSYFEGYGMVLEEAKILNKPIIITDTAAKEAVQNYPKSLIINNNEEDIVREISDKIFEKGII